MKKTLAVIFFISLFQTSYSQWVDNEQVVIDWSTVELIASGQNLISAPSFQGAVHHHENKLPLFSIKKQIPIDGQLKVTRTNEKWINLEASQLILTNTKERDIAPDYKTSTAGGSYFANIEFVPLRIKEDKLQGLVSFTLNIKVTPKESNTKRGPQFASESVLKEGTFFKIGISKEGMYQITGQQIADAYDINLSSVNPKKLKIYVGNAGKLSEIIEAERIDDLIETPITVSGETDNSFDGSDIITFYAQGPDVWTLENNEYTFIKNNYAEQNFVYLNIDGEDGLRMSDIPNASNATFTTSEYDFLQRYEEDKVNLLGSYLQTEGTGQEWYNDYFGLDEEKEFSSNFDFEGYISGSDAKVSYKMASRSSGTTRSTLTIGDNTITNVYGSTSVTNIESPYAKQKTGSAEMILPNAPEIDIAYDKFKSEDEAWLDWIEIINKRALRNYGSQTVIQNIETVDHNIAEFSADKNISFDIYNITNPSEVGAQQTSNNSWSFETNDELQRFILVSNFLTPEFIGPVENQNLHSIDETDMIVLHPTEFTEQAERFAEFRREWSSLNVTTVNVDLIYNEFSSGKLDPTAIRDFMKMIHDRTDNFKFLLLLGDASFDHRNIVNGLADHNFIPSYQTPESLNPIEGFPTDDFYGLLSDTEGGNLFGDLDIAVGRIPVETVEQADVILDKIINYESGANRFGDWRINIGFAADDEDSNTHLNQTDDIARYTLQNHPIYNQQKVYFDAFEQVSTPGGDRFYDASTSINKNIQNGQLMLNYLGHGGPNGWAQERVLKLSDIDSWNAKDKLPILVTATCTFTGYDDPNTVSAGEFAFRKKDGGCVALFTTVRAVYSNDNKDLADVIFQNVFNLENGTAQTLGEIMTTAKNSLTGSNTTINSRKFSLIGDPSMQIAIPTQNVQTTHINGLEVNATNLDTVRALEEVTISGIITNNEGAKLTGFNGTLYSTVFDKVSSIETLANDVGSQGSIKKKFDVYKNILFKGTANVTNGEFTYSFVLPKDINYSFGEGRISHYADNGTDLDAAGYFDDIVIGGSSDNEIVDDEGPQMQLFMNDRAFKDGGIVESDASLLVVLQDDLGINVSGTSIGHDLTATLDGDETFVLNSFYKADENTYKSGEALFPLTGLEPGIHRIDVKAWDIANNSTKGSISFEVVESLDGNVINIYNYPNPFSTSGTTFVFEHDMIGQLADIELYIYNSIGAHVATFKTNQVLTGNRVEIQSDSLEDFMRKIHQGIYYFKIKLTSNELNTTRESDFEKFVKIE